MTLITNLGVAFTGPNLPPRASRDPMVRPGTGLLMDFGHPATSPHDPGDLAPGTVFADLVDGSMAATVTTQSGPLRIRRRAGGGLLWPEGSGGASAIDYLDFGSLAGFDFDTRWALLVWVEFPAFRVELGTAYDRILGLGDGPRTNANESTFQLHAGAAGMRLDGTVLPADAGVGSSFGSSMYSDVVADAPVLYGMTFEPGIAMRQSRDLDVKPSNSQVPAALERDPGWRFTLGFSNGGIVYRLLLEDLARSGRSFAELIAAEHAWRAGTYG